MLLFRSKEDVLTTCARTSSPPGAILTLEQTWELARRWYGDRLDLTYRGRTIEQAREIFQSLGHSSPFWDAPAPQA